MYAFRCWLMVIGLASVAPVVWAFPSWMGVYGSYSRHAGSNPGTFTILMNEDDASLRAEVGIKVGNGTWRMFPMTRAGTVEINSIWRYTPADPFPFGTEIQYFFHGYDNAGRHIWDSRHGENYRVTFPGPVAVQWLGHVSHYPFDGEIDPVDDLWVNAESWPLGGAVAATVIYSTNGWATWTDRAMVRAGQKGNNDWWHLNLGRLAGGTRIEYVVTAIDGFGKTLWAKNGVANFTASVNFGAPVWWVGHQWQWPFDGQVTGADDFWVNVESWPRGSGWMANLLFSVNGGVWLRDRLEWGGVSGNNDWWHLNLGRFPPGSTIYYETGVIDQNGRAVAPSEGMASTRVAGSPADTDADGLPDAWEQFWWGGLAARPTDNPDRDGSAYIPLDNQSEFFLGTEPQYSNRLDSLSLIWKPARPTAGGLVRFSYEPSASQILSGTGTRIHVKASPGGSSLERGPLVRNTDSGRLETNLFIVAGTTNLTVYFSENGRLDRNQGLDWTIAIDPPPAGAGVDSDRDGLPDAWEIAYGLDPLDDGTYDHRHGPMGDADQDGFHNRDEWLAGSDPRNARSTPDTVGDQDSDGLPDSWERLIVEASLTDGIDSIHDVHPGDDFDGDGMTNGEEYHHGSGATDAASIPVGALRVTPDGAGGTFDDIQEAVDACPPHGWVLLHPGQYTITHPVSYGGKSIVLRGVGDGEMVRLRPAEDVRAFTFVDGESTNARLENVTVEGARLTGAGGALYIEDASPSIACVSFASCSAVEGGGALYIQGGAPRLDNLAFIDCVAYAAGGAVLVRQSTGVVINACRFIGNTARGPGSGGGALAADGADFVVRSSFFHGNRADGSGGALVARAASGSVARSTFSGNRAGEGLGMCIGSENAVISVSCSILWDHGDVEVHGAGVTVHDSIVQFAPVGTSNRNDDPMLVPGSFRLKRSSSCIDAGPVAANIPDIDGEPVLGHPDIGCDEYRDEDGNDAADAWERLHDCGMDQDGLALAAEYDAGTHPCRDDSDGDGLPDDWELSRRMNPLWHGDGMTVIDESRLPAFYAYYHQHAGQPAGFPVTLEDVALRPTGTTIQELIDAAPDFGVIELPSGVYQGPGNHDLVVTGKNLLITAADGAGECVIDGGGAGRGIFFGDGVDERTMLRGITVRNAVSGSSTEEGAGIRIIDASPVIESCVIVSNRAVIGGGGLYLEHSGATIRDCTIAHNRSDYNRGGGLSIRGGTSRVERTRILSNRVVGSGHLGGGGLAISGGELTMENSIIADNDAERNGDGLFVDAETRLSLANCTITSNRGQGIYRAGQLSMVNCIVWGNGSDCVYTTPVDYSPPVFSIIGGRRDAARGVSDTNPQLREDYRLSWDSPAIDAGSASGSPELDFDGEYRWDHPDHGNFVSWVDIGVDEFVDLDLDRVDNVTEYRLGGNPIAPDSDGDGLLDYEEFATHHTALNAADTDADGYTDRQEVDAGMDPLNARDGLSELNRIRRGIAAHWGAVYGGIPAYNHTPGSTNDLAQIDRYIKRLSDVMVREVYP